MKFFQRVITLLVPLVLLVQCNVDAASTPKHNIKSTIQLALNLKTGGNGVILGCAGEDVCVILTVAHLCNPEGIIATTIQLHKDHIISDKFFNRRLAELRLLAHNKLLCSGGARVGDVWYPVTALAVDFDQDLMILGTQIPEWKKLFGSNSTHLASDPYIKFATQLYAIVNTPSMRDSDKLVLFSYAGMGTEGDTFHSKIQALDMPGDVEKNYIQADFPIGPGASGSPVFRLSDNALVGLIDAQLSLGEVSMPIKSTFVIPNTSILTFIKKYQASRKADNVSKPDRIYCYGKVNICDVVDGKTSILDLPGLSNNKKAGK